MLMTVLEMACLAALAAALALAAATDLRSRIVPNGCVVVVAASGLVRSTLAAAAEPQGASPVLGSLGGMAVVLLVMLAAAGLSARAGRGSGVGGGDVKLLSAVGAWVGPVAGLVVVALSCAVGVAAWAIGAVARRDRPARAAESAIPLAPAVALSAMAVVLCGPATSLATL